MAEHGEIELQAVTNANEIDRLLEEDQDDNWMPIPRYATMRGETPQLIYYYARNKKIRIFDCKCGRPVIDVEEVDEFFRNLRKPKSKG